MSQAHGTALWREQPGNGAAPSVASIVFRFNAAISKWVPMAVPTAQARLLQTSSGGPYVLTDVRSSVPSYVGETLMAQVGTKVRSYTT